MNLWSRRMQQESRHSGIWKWEKWYIYQSLLKTIPLVLLLRRHRRGVGGLYMQWDGPIRFLIIVNKFKSQQSTFLNLFIHKIWFYILASNKSETFVVQQAQNKTKIFKRKRKKKLCLLYMIVFLHRSIRTSIMQCLKWYSPPFK